MFEKIKPYAKVIVAGVGALAAIATIVVDNSSIGPAQIAQIVFIILTAIGVHQVPNTGMQPYAKAIVAYSGAFVTTATMLATSGTVDSAKLLEMFTVFATALGVHQVPNAPLPQK